MSTRLLSGLAMVLILAAGAPALAAAPASVSIDNFTFNPPVLTVRVGATVTWTNQDDVPHALVADDKSFRSKVIDTDQSFSFTFAKPGEYSYFCSIHPHMTGKVVVKAL
jgi:amicyanin